MGFQSAKWALATLFLVDGTGFGLWAAHVPVFKQNLALTTGRLSLVLLSLVLGGIVSMPITGQLIAHLGSRPIVRVVGLAYIAMLAVLAQSSSFTMLMICAALFGMVKGAFDVSINAQAVAVEQHYGTSSMGILQGCWSLGGLAGAGAASILLRHGRSAAFNLSAGAALLLAVSALVLPLLVAERPAHGAARKKFVLPDAALLRLSVLAFFGLFAEGATGDWAAVYLRSNLGASLSLAAAAYAGYAVAMALTRFAGDWLTHCVEDKVILQASGLIVAVGFAAIVLGDSWRIGCAGLVLTGIGMANVFPVIVKVAGRDTRMGAGPAISTMATIGYFGFLSGPVFIGWLAVSVGLGHALLLVVLAGIIIAAGTLSVPLGRHAATGMRGEEA